MSILLTAFGPFGSNSYNPTEDVVRLVAQRWNESRELVVEILPVEYAAARARVVELGHFDIHLALGLAADRHVPTMERFALNRQDSAAPDNSGRIARGECIDAEAELALETSLPFKRLIAKAHAAGFDLRESHSAGLYVCNTVMFTGIQTSKCAGFVHLPPADVFSVEDGAALVELLLAEMRGYGC